MAMILKLIFVLSTLISITVSHDVARLVGDSVQLDYGQDSETVFSSLFWKFNRTNNILKYDKEYNDITVYKDRVEFNNKTYSLTLKNLQKNDSGLYEAKTTGAQVKVVANYSLSVWDPVETPVLTQLNNDTCNITLTCTAYNLSINSSCVNGTCEEKEVRSPEGDVTLSLTVKGRKNICTLRNPVSQKTRVLDMDLLCKGSVIPAPPPRESGSVIPAPPPRESGSGSSAPAPGVSVCLLYSIILILVLSNLF